MRRILKTIHGYIFWTYGRGTVHYDVMVTLILAFIFLAPLWINFKDRPIARSPHPIEVVVMSDGGQGFIYEVDAAAVRGSDDSAIREDLLRVIEPIAGEVEIAEYKEVRDPEGHITEYRVRVFR